MRVTFVLPGLRAIPSGGPIVVYEYANRLAARGHSVQLVFPSPDLAVSTFSLATRPRLALQSVLQKCTGGRIGWFEISPTVGRLVLLGPQRRPARLPPADVTIATAWQTASLVARSDGATGQKAYLIQHYETWNSPGRPDLVDDSWRLPLQKIVISRWLRQRALELGDGGAVYIPNGINFSELGIDRPIRDRRAPLVVGMLWHPSSWKGSHHGLRALELARERIPRLRVALYGAVPRPPELPSWATYVQGIRGPDLRDYFNSLSVFLHPSLVEGWPLPPAEAMACGATLIAADNPGVLDYADSSTAVIVPREQPRAMAEAIGELAHDEDRRVALAEAAHDHILAFTWPRAVQSFESVLLKLVTGQAS